MGVEYSAVLVVGLPQSKLVVEKVIPREVPVFNRRTGVQEGFESDPAYAYFVGDVEVPDDMSPTEFLMEAGLEFTPCAEGTDEMFFGEVLSNVCEGAEVPDLSVAAVNEAAARVTAIFEGFGIKEPPKLYHALCIS